MQAPSTPATSYTASLRNCVTESLNAKGGNDQDSAYGEGHSLIDNPYALFLRDSSLADSDHAYSSGLTSSGSSLVSESYAAASSTSTDYQPWSSDDQHEVAPSHSYALFTSLSSEPTTNAASSSSDPVPQTSLSKEPPVVVDGSKIERDWTREFNEIAAQRTLDAAVRLRELSEAFTEQAKRYAKTIIDELPLPAHLKTIPPVSVGGIAGGEKFIHGGIFFKFALDLHGLYNGDEYAMKVASHELKGLMALFHCAIANSAQVLGFPLMCLVSYAGFRIIATSILPISANSLVYGCCDGGRTVHKDEPVVSKQMQYFASILNLKEHTTGFTVSQALCMPGDIEVHRGQDGRFYVLDTARVFPPTTPMHLLSNTLGTPVKPKKSSFLFQLMRPEMVAQSPVPLSSDSFCGWGQHDADTHNRETHESTLLLIDKARQFAEKLERDHGSSATKQIPLTKAKGVATESAKSDDQAPPASSAEQQQQQQQPPPVPRDGSSGYFTDTDLDLEQQQDARDNSSTPPPAEELDEMGIPQFTRDRLIATRARIEALDLFPLVLLADLSGSTPSPPPTLVSIGFLRRVLTDLHTEGINFRLMGLVRSQLNTPELKELLLIEMVARSFKNLVRQSLRAIIRSGAPQTTNQQNLAESNKKLLAEAFSNLLDLSPDSSGYWKALQSKCCESFPKSLTNDEQQPNALSFASLSDLGRTLLLQRAQELAGVALAASSFAKPLSAADVTDVLILSKHMYIIEYNEATALSRTAAQLQGSTKASQYLHSSREKFERGLQLWPGDCEAFLNYGVALMEQSKILSGRMKFECLAQAAASIWKSLQTCHRPFNSQTFAMAISYLAFTYTNSAIESTETCHPDTSAQLFDDGYRLFHIAMEIAPKYMTPYLQLGVNRHNYGRLMSSLLSMEERMQAIEEAIVSYGKLISIVNGADPLFTSEAYNNMGVCHLSQLRIADSNDLKLHCLAAAEKAFLNVQPPETPPGEPPSEMYLARFLNLSMVFRSRAQIYQAANDNKQAIHELEHAIELTLQGCASNVSFWKLPHELALCRLDMVGLLSSFNEKTEQLDQALEQLLHAAELNSETPVIYEKWLSVWETYVRVWDDEKYTFEATDNSDRDDAALAAFESAASEKLVANLERFKSIIATSHCAKAHHSLGSMYIRLAVTFPEIHSQDDLFDKAESSFLSSFNLLEPPRGELFDFLCEPVLESTLYQACSTLRMLTAQPRNQLRLIDSSRHLMRLMELTTDASKALAIQYEALGVLANLCACEERVAYLRSAGAAECAFPRLSGSSVPLIREAMRVIGMLARVPCDSDHVFAESLVPHIQDILSSTTKATGIDAVQIYACVASILESIAGHASCAAEITNGIGYIHAFVRMASSSMSMEQRCNAILEKLLHTVSAERVREVIATLLYLIEATPASVALVGCKLVASLASLPEFVDELAANGCHDTMAAALDKFPDDNEIIATAEKTLKLLDG